MIQNIEKAMNETDQSESSELKDGIRKTIRNQPTDKPNRN